MNSRQLMVFKVVAEMGSFTKAARELSIVQPAVSNTIKKLEDELQLPLFIRKDKSVSLTPEGEVLLKNARIIMRSFKKAELEMVELLEMERGEVRLGVTNTLGMYYFPKIIEVFKNKYPKLHFSVQIFGLRKMQQMIEEDQLDMGVVILEDMSKGMEGCHFFTDEIVACASKTHPFSKREVVSHQEFVREPLIGFTKGTYQREIIESTCRQEKIDPDIVFETNLIPLIKNLVGEGHGVSSFLRPVIEDDSRIEIIPFDPPIYVQFAMAWKKGSHPSMANQAFIDFILEYEQKRREAAP